ncbi:hypothetical protein D3C76_1228610 [compost metagenome]
MPGTVQTGDKLSDLAVTLNKKMRRHTQVLDTFEIRVFAGIQAVLKELLDLAGPKLRRRQADVVDNQQGDDFTLGAGIAVG